MQEGVECFENVNVSECNNTGKQAKGRLDRSTSVKFISRPQPLSAGSTLNKSLNFSTSSST